MVWKVIVIIFMVAGLLSLFVGLPGTFIILGVALVYGACTHFQVITVRLLLLLLGIAAVGEIVEAFLGLFVAKKFGASKLSLFFAAIGGFVGAIVGSVILPLVGTVIGALAGAFVGAFVPELALKKKMGDSVSAGVGAFLGRTMGLFTKLFLGAAMLVLVIADLFR